MDSSCDSYSDDDKLQDKSVKHRKRSPEYHPRHESKNKKVSVSGKRKNANEYSSIHSSKGKETFSSEHGRSRHRSPRREKKHTHEVYNHRSSHSYGYETFRSRSRSPKRSRSKSLKRSKSRSPRKSRSRSPRKSRSRSPRRYNKHSKDDSPKRRSSFHFERSPRRSFDGKPSKFSLLEKMGIELKIPAVEKEGPSNTAAPNYLNPLGLTATKYAEQIAKRKLLWKNKSTSEEERNGSKNSTLWQGARFSQDQDGKLTAKFQRLMGIKTSGEGSSSATQDKDLIKKQEELFSSMEMQYEVARATTHTQRGVGLGFSHRHVP